MTKKHFIALADKLIATRPTADAYATSGRYVITTSEPYAQWEADRDAIADQCAESNPRFNRERWLGYIAGTNGPSGGQIKQTNRNGDGLSPEHRQAFDNVAQKHALQD